MLRGKKRLAVVGVVSALAAVIVPSALATATISASKTATAHWTQSYSWTISKSVDVASHTLENGKSATSNYTVAVTKTLASERIWVDGEVCVKNESDAPTENLKIADRIRVQKPDGNFATLEKGLLDTSAKPVLEGGESHCYGYSFDITPVEGALEYRNIASATVTNDPREPGAELGPTTFAIFTMPGAPSVTNGTVDVDDTNGMSWQFSDSGSVSYAKTFTCGADAGSHVNTATIRQTAQSASATVAVTCKQPPKECKPGKPDKPGHGGKDGDKGDKDDKDHRPGSGWGWGGWGWGGGWGGR
ncbi:MAG: hypothetical protein U0R50_12520 [Gaiellales bacterium]